MTDEPIDDYGVDGVSINIGKTNETKLKPRPKRCPFCGIDIQMVGFDPLCKIVYHLDNQEAHCCLEGQYFNLKQWNTRQKLDVGNHDVDEFYKEEPDEEKEIKND